MSAVHPAQLNREVLPTMDQYSSEDIATAERYKRRQKNRGSHKREERCDEGAGDEDNLEREVESTLALLRKPSTPVDTKADLLFREQRLVETRLLLNQLHKQLDTAYNVYKDVFDNFQSQAEKLKDFANTDTLDKIWADMLRAEAKKREREAAKVKNNRSVDFDTVAAQVGLCLKHLRSAEREGLPAVPGCHKRNNSIEQELRSVISAVEEVMELATRAPADRLACEEMVPCLERAWSSTDTESSNWKVLLGKLPATGNERTGSEDVDRQ